MRFSSFKGLNDDEVAKSRELHGTNQIAEAEVETFFQKLLGNLADPIIRILILALVLNVLLMLGGYVEWYEPVGIAMAVSIAIFVSTLSEYSNEQSFQKLQAEASKILIKTFRNNEVLEIPVEQIVVGDEVLLLAGDKIPADGRVVDGSVHVDQSVLNGESKEAEKRCDSKMDDASLEMDFLDGSSLFRGTVVTEGEAVMCISKVGVNTIYGRLAAELQGSDRESPLKIKLMDLADQISKVGYVGAGLIAFAYLLKTAVFDNNIAAYLTAGNLMNVINDGLSALILAVIIIVVAVPEGLPMMIAMVLSMNMKKLLADQILVRKMVGIETAGSLNLLFTDKTGTLTKGQLEVTGYHSAQGKAYKCVNEVPDKLRTMVEVSIRFNSSAVINVVDNKRQVIGGNTTERALMHFVTEDDAAYRTIKVIDTVPFNSREKYSAALVDWNGKQVLVKGAPEVLLGNCDCYMDESGDSIPFKEADKEALDVYMAGLAQKGIRVLAFAIASRDTLDNPLVGLSFVGLAGITDVVRKESYHAIQETLEAGIQVVMITGDRKETAVAIAEEVGLVTQPDDLVITSSELASMTDSEVQQQLQKLRVIARALPEDKSRLVKLAQGLNYVIGMTGDGVNDAPALKKADVGFAMGSGTEVAKEASDIVILDDNFKSITRTILYGRTVFKSIRKFIVFQLTVNMSAVLIAFIGPFIGIKYPITITQFLWINLIMDTLAALAFGGEPALEKFMKEKPKTRDEKIVNKSMGSAILVNGSFITIASVLFFKLDVFKAWFDYDNTVPMGQNTYFLSVFFSLFVLMHTVNMLNARTDSMNIFEHIAENKNFIRVMLLIITVQVVMTFIGGEVLRLMPIHSWDWLLISIVASCLWVIEWSRKWVVTVSNK